jgi:DNA mismatch endonuclease (patch repair protein)
LSFLEDKVFKYLKKDAKGIASFNFGYEYIMTDNFTKKKRSWVMSRIRSGDTSPERFVRSFLHLRGFRFRLHRKDLPGKPDIILPRYKTVIFVHGCFWHQCPACRGGRLPKSNLDYWGAKLKRNQERDKENTAKLELSGWRVITIWACDIGIESLKANLLQQLATSTL